MKSHQQARENQQMAEIERKAWFARLAFGAPHGEPGEVPAMPSRRGRFEVLP